VPINRLKGFEKCEECRKIAPMPDQTALVICATMSSRTLSWAQWPHQISTSVSASLPGGNPWSGWSSVAVVAAMPGPAFSASAMQACMPFG